MVRRISSSNPTSQSAWATSAAPSISSKNRSTRSSRRYSPASESNSTSSKPINLSSVAGSTNSPTISGVTLAWRFSKNRCNAIRRSAWKILKKLSFAICILTGLIRSISRHSKIWSCFHFDQNLTRAVGQIQSNPKISQHIIFPGSVVVSCSSTASVTSGA